MPEVNNIETTTKPSKFRALFSFLRRHWLASLIVLLVVFIAIILISWQSGNGQTELQTSEAQLLNLREEVSLTGRIKSPEKLDLALEAGGRISSVRGKAGTQVRAGDVLVSVNNPELQVQLRQATANLERERIRLRQLQAGIRDTDFNVSEAALNSARVAANNAATAYQTAVTQTQFSIDNLLGVHIDHFFTNPRNNSASFGFRFEAGNTQYNISGTQTENRNISQQRRDLNDQLSNWSEDTAETTLLNLQKFLGDMSLVINAYQPTNTNAQAVYNNFKADVSAARSTASSLLTSIQSARQAKVSAEAALQSAQRQHESASAPAANDELALQELNIQNAQDQIDLIRLQIAKQSITSPVDGRIVEMNARVGEIGGPSQVLVSVLSNAELEIEARIPETDIGKVKQGNIARITIDAYPGETFEAKVVYVSPTETLLETLATYRAVLHFNQKYEQLRPGLTADMEVTTALREQVVAVPQRAVITKSNQRFVRIKEGENIIEKEVTTGIRGVDGMIEVRTGLDAGQIVVTSRAD